MEPGNRPRHEGHRECSAARVGDVEPVVDEVEVDLE
jgi:hypothetical protein